MCKWYTANREKKQADNRKWYAANWEKKQGDNRKSYAANRVKTSVLNGMP